MESADRDVARLTTRNNSQCDNERFVYIGDKYEVQMGHGEALYSVGIGIYKSN